jgi:hypothetical protein
MALFEILQQALVSVVVAYLGFTNTVGDRIQAFFSDTSETTEISEETSIPLYPEADIKTPARTAADVLRRDANFQRAALIAANQGDHEYTAPDTLETEELLRESLVNIYCQYKTDTHIRTTTGTGFFINAKGVILTNAHVAQFLLLEDSGYAPGTVECIIRSGDPATPRYEAELLYISPNWIFENASLISDEHPRGTGERDYALLYVSASLNKEPLPVRFPALPFDVALLPRNTEGKTVITGGYPAGALLRGGADAALAPVVAGSTIGSLYTFGSNYADLFAVAESPVGEEGASGGPIVESGTGKTIGLIVTRGDEALEGPRSLRALTLSYLDRSMQEETGFSLAQNMQGDVALRGGVFKQAILPFLAEILGGELTTER